MQFGCFGINYKQAKLDIRQKASFTDVQKITFFQEAEKIGICQCMILSTCNRSEVYYIGETKEQRDALLANYCKLFSVEDEIPYLTQKEGEDAVQYLFRVTAGFESLVLGEDQILGQVKEALDVSRTMGYSGKEMNKIVRDAITCAKQIKTELRMSEKPLSVSYIGVKKLQMCGGILGKAVLVIGSGQTSERTIQYLIECGAKRIIVCSRTYAHAKRLREAYEGVECVPYEDRYVWMTNCDIVVSATSSPHLVIQEKHVVVEKPMVFLDLASPRDVDVLVSEKENVQLIDLDQLEQVADENRRGREALLKEGEKIIMNAMNETLDWLFHSRVDDTIDSLQQRSQEIVEDSFSYLNRKMELSSREQKLLRKVLHASLQRLIREPIQQLKQVETEEKQREYQEVIRELFQMDE